jgi:hypothetical protein
MPLSDTHRARLQSSVAAVISVSLWGFTRAPIAAAFAFVLVALSAIAWCSPRTYAPVQRALERAARALAAGFTWTILAIVYFGIFTPFRLWRQIIGKDPLAQRGRPVNDSYLQPVASSGTPRFDRQF